MIAGISLRRYDYADWYHERIEHQIEDFSQELEDDEDIVARVILNDGQQILATWFGFHNPNMLVIDGRDNAGNEVRVLAPHTNVQIIIRKVNRADQTERRRIGFQTRRNESEEP